MPKRQRQDQAGKIEAPAARNGCTFAEVCQVLCKPYPYLRQLQAKLGLPIPDEHREGYPEAYIAFLNSVVVLRTFGVSVEDIADLFETEKKLLHLLRVDTLTESKTWYLDFCGPLTESGNRLLLTHYDLGRSVTQNAVQFHLDFGRRDAELFTSSEMGEDIRRVMTKYRKLLAKVRERIRAEEPVLREALTWARAAFSDAPSSRESV
jgi:hypothetical protein